MSVGRPPPELSWWNGAQKLDSVDTTDLTFGRGGARARRLRIQRLDRHHLHQALHCEASNNNISRPVSSSVAIDLRREYCPGRGLPV